MNKFSRKKKETFNEWKKLEEEIKNISLQTIPLYFINQCVIKSNYKCTWSWALITSANYSFVFHKSWASMAFANFFYEQRYVYNIFINCWCGKFFIIIYLNLLLALLFIY